jgi:dihydropyrimidinase
MSVLIRNGRIITATDDYVADIFIAEETVSAIGTSLDMTADRVIDAAGRYVLPGGVDPHTHMEMPSGGTVTCDDFTSGTVSAAFGGTTTIVDFAIQQHGQSLPDALAMWQEKMQRCPPVIDVGFHIAVTSLSAEGSVEDLAKLVDEGVTSFKLFLAYPGSLMVDDEVMFQTMQVAAQAGALVMVHCENGGAIQALVTQALAAGRVEPHWHGVTRPPLTEAEATSRAIDLAELAGCSLYIVHVSCAESLAPVLRARAAGQRVSAETCTHYLFIDETRLDEPDFGGAKYVFTPPPRSRENHDVLWRALAGGGLSAVTSDHCAFNWGTQKSLGRDDFSKIPNGAPGIEHRLTLLHHFGVRGGRIGLNQFVELCSTAPARMFGLFPRKGTIAVGSDADIVIWDPDKPLRISVDTHHSNVDYNMYEGTEVVGAPEVVLVRGQVVVDHDELVAAPGAGQFIARARVGEHLELVTNR